MTEHKLYVGHTLGVLKELPSESVDCIATSPPYFGLRDYGKETETIWDGDPKCEHDWISLNTCSPLLSIKTERIALIDQTSKSNTFLNPKINTKSTGRLIEVRRKSINPKKIVQPISKVKTSSGKANSAVLINCPIAIKYSSDKMPFNLGRNRGKFNDKALSRDDIKGLKKANQREGRDRPPPDNTTLSCPLLCNRLGWCDAIPNKFSEFLIFTDEASHSDLSDVPIGYNQTYQVGEFWCPFLKKVKIYIPFLIGSPFENVRTFARAKRSGMSIQLPFGAINGFVTGETINHSSCSTIGSGQLSPVHNKYRNRICNKCGAIKCQLGLEPFLEKQVLCLPSGKIIEINGYVEHLLQITAELKRILKPTGVIYWNHGDSYGGSWQGYGNRPENTKHIWRGDSVKSFPPSAHAPSKCLMMQNDRLIQRMIDEQGWILRNKLIWNKSNSMPSSVKDRFSNNYEPIYMLVKNIKPVYYYNIKTGAMVDRKPNSSVEGVDWDYREVGAVFNVRVSNSDKERFMEKATPEEIAQHKQPKLKKVSNWRGLQYWFDLDSIRIPHKGTGGGPGFGAKELQQNRNYEQREHPVGKNPGDVFTLPTQSYSEAHFAVFPGSLILPFIKSSCPKEVCPVCGKARVRITEKEFIPQQDVSPEKGIRGHVNQKQMDDSSRWQGVPRGTTKKETVGWTSCSCGKGYVPGVVLDPFAGSGTSMQVAKELGRNSIGIEIQPKYIPMILKRTGLHTVSMWKECGVDPEHTIEIFNP